MRRREFFIGSTVRPAPIDYKPITVHAKEAKVMKAKFLAAVAAVATILAATVASSACWWYIYQPEEPESLKNL